MVAANNDGLLLASKDGYSDQHRANHHRRQKETREEADTFYGL